MKKDKQGELFTGRELRDLSITQVGDNNENWMGRCRSEARQWIQQQTVSFTGEDIRFHCFLRIGSPRHPNAWGALINWLAREKAMIFTGQMREPKDRTSHARLIKVYVKNDAD